jgi:YD repeat-containing protein
VKTAQQIKQTSRRRTAWILAVTFILSNQSPLIVGLAAPSVFVRPQLGVSRAPLNVMSFGDPGFGEVAEAINVANGNLFVSGEQVAKNNTPSNASQNANTIGATGWSTTNRLRLVGFQSNLATAPDTLSLEMGDQSTVPFKKVVAVSFAQSPKWIQRYQSAASGAWTFYSLQSQPGVAYQAEWIALQSGSNAIAHYYNASGTRYSFYQDGEYADYWQTPDQQYRNAKQGLTEGKPYAGQPNPFASGFGALNEINYDGQTGRITRIADEYGRITKYEWNSNQTLKQINELLSNETNADSYARRTDFQYTTAQNLISAITYTTRDGRGSTISRTTQFAYDNVGRITRITRDAVSGTKVTTYTYNAQPELAHLITSVAVRDGAGVLLEPETYYQYSSNNTALLNTMAITPLQVERLQKQCNEKSRIVKNDGFNDKQAVVLGCAQDTALFRVPENLPSGMYQIKLRANSKNGATVLFKNNNQRIAKRDWKTSSYQMGDLATTSLKAGDRLSLGILNQCVSQCDPSQIAIDQLELHQTSLRITPQQGIEVADKDTTSGKAYSVNDSSTVVVPDGVREGFYRVRVRVRADEVQGTPSLDLLVSGNIISGTTLVKKNGWNTLDLGAVQLEAGTPLGFQFASSRKRELGRGKNLQVEYIEFSRMTTSAPGSKVLTITQGDQSQTYEVDLFNRLRKRTLRDTNPVTGAGRDLTWSYQYYKSGNIALEIEPSGRTTHYAYDADGYLLRRTVYRSNPFSEGYTPQIMAGLTFRELQDLNNDSQPDRVFTKGQTVKVFASVRYDYARQGVDWKLQDENGTVLYNSVSPVANQANYQFTVEAPSEVDNTGVYLVRAEFKAPDYAIPAGNTTPSTNFTKGYRLIATTRNSAVISEATFSVTSQIKGIRFVNFPTELIVAPNCVQTSVQYESGAGCGIPNAPMTVSLSGQAVANEYFPNTNTGLTWSIQQAPGSGFSLVNDSLTIPYDTTLLTATQPKVDLQACSVAEPTQCAQIPIKLRFFQMKNTSEYTNPVYRWDNDATITDGFVGGVPNYGMPAPKFEGAAHNRMGAQENKQLAVQAINVPRGYAPPIQWSVADWYHYMNNDYYYRFEPPNDQPLYLGFPYSYTDPNLNPPLGLGRPYSEYSGLIDNNGCFRSPLVSWDGALWYVRRESRFIKIRATIPASNQTIENWIRVDFREINYNPNTIPACAGGVVNGVINGSDITYAQPGAGGNPVVRPQDVAADAASWTYSYGDVNASTNNGTENPLAVDNQPDFDRSLKSGFISLELMAYDQHRRVTSSFSANDTTGLTGAYTGVEQRSTFGILMPRPNSNLKF